MNEGLPKHPIDSKSAVSSNWFYYMRHQALRAHAARLHASLGVLLIDELRRCEGRE